MDDMWSSSVASLSEAVSCKYYILSNSPTGIMMQNNYYWQLVSVTSLIVPCRHVCVCAKVCMCCMLGVNECVHSCSYFMWIPIATCDNFDTLGSKSEIEYELELFEDIWQVEE